MIPDEISGGVLSGVAGQTYGVPGIRVVTSAYRTIRVGASKLTSGAAAGGGGRAGPVGSRSSVSETTKPTTTSTATTAATTTPTAAGTATPRLGCSATPGLGCSVAGADMGVRIGNRRASGSRSWALP